MKETIGNFRLSKTLVLLFLIIVAFHSGNIAFAQCDCLGYYEPNNPDARIVHNHDGGICVGWAFSHKASDMGTTFNPDERSKIYIDQGYAKKYYTEWGFYQVVSGPYYYAGDIAIDSDNGDPSGFILHAAYYTGTSDAGGKIFTYMVGPSGPYTDHWDEYYAGDIDFWIRPTSKRIYGITGTVKNSFNTGKVIVDGYEKNSGVQFSWAKNSSHSLAVNTRQYYAPYWRIYQQWVDLKHPYPPLATAPDYTASVMATTNKVGTTFQADFNKEYNVVFKNYFSGTSDPGKMEIDNVLYDPVPSSSEPFPVEQYESITADAVSCQIIGGIRYSFDHWTGGSTSQSKTFTPTGHTTYTAYFTGIPSCVTNVRDVGLIGESIEIEWDQHPNANCIYKIWRSVKVQSTGKTTISFLATLPHSTTSYTDNHYTKTRTYTKYLLKYDVRAYYTVENTSAEPNYNLTIFGGGPLEKNTAKDDSTENIIYVPDKYDVIAYPNPFNTSTVISYQLVDGGFVSLNIYDMIGRKAIELLSEPNQAGIYTIRWNGQDDAGNSLPSGIYLYRFCVRPHNGGERFQKVGKLLFAK